MKGLKGGFHTPQQFSPGTRRSGAGLGTQGWGRTAPSSPAGGLSPPPPPGRRSPYPSVIWESWMGASSSTWLQRCARASSLRERGGSGGLGAAAGRDGGRRGAAYSWRQLKRRWHTSRMARSSLPSRDTSCSSSPTASTSSSTDSKSAPLLCRIPAGTRRYAYRDTSDGRPPLPRAAPSRLLRGGEALTRHVSEHLAVQLREFAAEDVGTRRHGAAGAGPGPSAAARSPAPRHRRKKRRRRRRAGAAGRAAPCSRGVLGNVVPGESACAVRGTGARCHVGRWAQKGWSFAAQPLIFYFCCCSRFYRHAPAAGSQKRRSCPPRSKGLRVLGHPKHCTSPQLPKSTGEKTKLRLFAAANTCRQLEAH